jgi:hypothetical protein
MRTKAIILSVVFCAGIFSVFGCHHRIKHKVEIQQNVVQKIVYTCEMDTDVKSDKPGKCPKCGMELVKKEIKEEKGR